MTKKSLAAVAIIAIVAFLLVPHLASQAQGPPEPPCWFYGTVGINGSAVPDSFKVTARIRGTNLNWTATTINGTYGWPSRGGSSFKIPYDNSTTSYKDGGENGDTIDFFMNGTKTNQTATYESQDVLRVDIFIGAPFVLDISPPRITIISPENKTYTERTLPLTFTINETTTWIGYGLDNQANQTLNSGNGTLSGLALGSHNITVYAKDIAGNEGSSQIVFFTVGTGTEQPIPGWIIFPIAIAALFGILFLVLLLRRRSKSNVQELKPMKKQNLGSSTTNVPTKS